MIKRCCFLIVVICIVAELHSILYAIWPFLATFDTRTWFIKEPNFTVTALWWVKILGDTLKWVLIYYIVCIVAKPFSKKLYIVSVIMCIKSGLNVLFFFYDFCQSFTGYWITGTAVISAIITMFSPVKEKTDGAIVKSIE